MNESEFIQVLFERSRTDVQRFPDKKLAESFADQLFDILFTPFKKEQDSKEKLLIEYKGLQNTLSAILFDIVHDKSEVEDATEYFFDAIPSIYQQLLDDAAAIVQFDPAAKSIEEVLVAYPGFYATAIYRLAHQLHLQEIPTLPRLLSEYAHSKTGIDIHPGAQIGDSFFIDHGTGIVIGETTIIGNNVKVYQGVTLGALSVEKSNADYKRHPTIGDDVIIYSGATILGGDTVIGDNSIIGGNVWLTQSVDANSVVYHQSQVSVRGKIPFPEPLNFVI